MNEKCEGCKQRTIRKDENEGTLVCITCGLVAASRVPVSHQNERIITDDNGSSNRNQVARTGHKMNYSQINRMGLVYGSQQGNYKRGRN